MKKISLLVLSCFLTFSMFGQLKKITLEESVLQQNRQFRADKLLGFQWIPNTNQYLYFAESGKKLMTASVSNSTATELISLADFNNALGTDLKSFFGIEAKNSNTLIIANGTKFYEYNIATKTGKLTTEFSRINE